MISDQQTFERARSLANEGLFTIALQRRRLRTEEPEDKEFVMRWWVDLQFLIIALSRFRGAIELAQKNISSGEANLRAALDEFDRAIPALKIMRNVGEHADEYSINKGHNENIGRKKIQAGTFDGNTYRWLDHTLNLDDSLEAAKRLFSALLKVRQHI